MISRPPLTCVSIRVTVPPKTIRARSSGESWKPGCCFRAVATDYCVRFERFADRPGRVITTSVDLRVVRNDFNIFTTRIGSKICNVIMSCLIVYRECVLSQVQLRRFKLESADV